MSLAHLIREPAGDPPHGALILNHGRGTDEHDLYGLLDELDPERRLLGVTPGAPLTGIPPGGRHWYLVPRVGFPDPDSFDRSYRMLSEFLRSEEHTSELQSHSDLVCRLLLEKKKKITYTTELD